MSGIDSAWDEKWSDPKEPESDGGWTPEAIKAAAFSTPDEEEAWQAKERSLYDEIKGGFDALESDRIDNVNKPKHYQLRDGYEVYDLRQDLARKAHAANVRHDQYSDWDRALEYLLRMWNKNGLEDAKKGRWYLDKLIGKLEANQ